MNYLTYIVAGEIFICEIRIELDVIKIKCM